MSVVTCAWYECRYMCVVWVYVHVRRMSVGTCGSYECRYMCTMYAFISRTLIGVCVIWGYTPYTCTYPHTTHMCVIWVYVHVCRRCICCIHSHVAHSHDAHATYPHTTHVCVIWVSICARFCTVRLLYHLTLPLDYFTTVSEKQALDKVVHLLSLLHLTRIVALIAIMRYS